MVLDTGSIREGHSTILQSSALEAVKEDLPPLSGEIECQVLLDRSGTVIHSKVVFSGSCELECARCLATYQQAVSGELRLILKEDQTRHGAAGEDETADFYFNTQYPQVDISSALFEEIMISLPLKPLCNDECKGFAAYCADAGSDKRKKEPDPRWDALKKLKKTDN